MEKTLTLRRDLSQRDNADAVHWLLSESFEGLGQVGMGKYPSILDTIVAARDAGYNVIIPDEATAGFTILSSEARRAISEALRK